MAEKGIQVTMVNRVGKTNQKNKVNKAGTTKQKAGRFLVVGTSITIFDYLVYELLVMIFFGGNAEKAAIASVISGTIATLVAFVAHSRITWKTRDVGKTEIIRFFVWNIITMWILRPILAAGTGLLDPLYGLAQGIFNLVKIPFSFEFVKSTGIFVLTTAVIMLLNYLVYDNFVFGAKAGKGKYGKRSANPRRKRA